MKKVLICICILICTIPYVASAETYDELISKATEISVALETTDNSKALCGEAVILMIENDVMSLLKEKGLTETATKLKQSADVALSTSANTSEKQDEVAVNFSKDLVKAIEILSSYKTQIGFVESTDSIVFTNNIQKATFARCNFIKTSEPVALKLIVGKYNKNTNILDKIVEIVNVGENVKVGNERYYNIPLDDYDESYYYRIFLWNGATLEPVLPSDRIG